MYGEQADDRVRRVRVLWLIKGLGPGGAEQLLLLAAKVASHAEFEYSVAFVRRDKTHLVPEFEELGVTPHLLGADSRRPLGWLADLREVMSHSDIVHVHSPVLASAARLVARSIRPRPVVVTTEHNEWTSHRVPTRLLNALTGPLDAATWAVSEQVRNTVWSPMRQRFEVLIHGIDTDGDRPQKGRAEVREALGLSDGHVVSLTVANLRRNKDYPNLIAAATEACGSNPDLRFIAVGQGPLQEELEDLHRSTGLGDRFQFLGYRRDIPDLMEAADIFTLGSAHEGLPVAIMEAFAAGLPVVATAVGGVPDQVRNGIDGFVVPPKNAPALADALTTAAGDPELRRRMSQSALGRATSFDIRTAVKVQEDRYKRLVSPATRVP